MRLGRQGSCLNCYCWDFVMNISFALILVKMKIGEIKKLLQENAIKSVGLQKLELNL